MYVHAEGAEGGTGPLICDTNASLGLLFKGLAVAGGFELKTNKIIMMIKRAISRRFLGTVYIVWVCFFFWEQESEA